MSLYASLVNHRPLHKTKTFWLNILLAGAFFLHPIDPLIIGYIGCVANIANRLQTKGRANFDGKPR